jgi:hypothetical protein
MVCIPRIPHRLPDYFLVVSVTVVPGCLFAYFLVTNLPVFALLWILCGEPFFAMSPSSYDLPPENHTTPSERIE